MFFDRHEHKWEEIERFYAEPVGGDTKYTTDRPSMRNAHGTHEAVLMALGCTTVLYRCECGEFRNHSVPGMSITQVMQDPNFQKSVLERLREETPDVEPA